MHAGLDLARTQKTPGTLAERVFAGLFPGWTLHALAGGCIAVPRGTPVITGESLGTVVGQISGAAVRDRCPNGTGWPARISP